MSYNSEKAMNKFEMSTLCGSSVEDMLTDPVIQTVFITVESHSDTSKGVTFEEINTELSKIKKSEVLRGIKCLEKTPIVSEELDVDFNDPTQTKTLYSVSDIPPELEEEIRSVIESSQEQSSERQI